MTEWVGTFLETPMTKAVTKTEAHQRAQTDAERERNPLPETVPYEVAWEPAEKIRTSRSQKPKPTSKESDAASSEQSSTSEDDESRFVVASVGGNTLRRPIVVRITYMDVGCWGGSAPEGKNTADHWKKQRYFGIVYETLAVLCAYKPWKYSGEGPTLKEAKTVPSKFNFARNPQYQKVRPLLESLSTDPELGPVVVLQVVLNSQSGVESPPDDCIHVILGDLHAPVMTKKAETYAGRPEPPSRSGTGQSRSMSTSAGGADGQVTPSSAGAGIDPSRSVSTLKGPGGTTPTAMGMASSTLSDYDASIATGLSSDIPSTVPSASPARDDRSTNVDPGVGGVLYPLQGRYNRGTAAAVLVPILRRILGGGTSIIAQRDNILVKVVEDEAVGSATVIALPVLLGSLTVAMGDIALSTGLDDDAVPASVVEDWFDRYHGANGSAGADIFDDAGRDLVAWLHMLESYQGGVAATSTSSTHVPAKIIQVGDLFDFWIGLKCPFDLAGGARDFPNPSAAKKFVRHWLGEFLKNEAIKALWNFAAAPKVILHGNHDTYMGATELWDRPLPAQFVDKGLIVEHGHKDDPFNKESAAALGYLLTQAAFVDNQVRLLEDNMSSVKTMVLGGLWTRLGYNESAVMACVRDRIADGRAIASTFVMGHTHEPVLQRIDIVEGYCDPSKRTATDKSLAESPRGVEVLPAGPGVSQSRHASTSTDLPEVPTAGAPKPVKTRVAVPDETPIPPTLQWYKSGK